MMKITEINSSEMTEKSRPICTFDWTFLGEKRNSLLEQLYPSNLYATCRYELYVNVFGVARFVQSVLWSSKLSVKCRNLDVIFWTFQNLFRPFSSLQLQVLNVWLKVLNAISSFFGLFSELANFGHSLKVLVNDWQIQKKLGSGNSS